MSEKTTTKRINITLSCFCPDIVMEIPVPENRDTEEYIDEFLDSILQEDLRYNADWEFA